MIDHLIVGAGSAGCVLAARLADRGEHVVLLEAGEGRGGAALESPNFFAALAEPGRIWADLAATRTDAQGLRAYRRGRGVGGSSAINAMVALEGLPQDYDRWGVPGWSWADLARHRPDVLIPVELAPTLGSVDRAFIEGAASLGHPVVADASRELGVGPVGLTIHDGRRVSAFDAYVRPRPQVDVRTGARVDRVLLEGRRAIGVRLVDGTELVARHVVLSAGAIHTPAILARSGVERPDLGANLQDHPAVQAVLMLRAEHRRLDDSEVVAAALGRWSSGRGEGDLQFLPLNQLGGGPDGRAMGMVMVALMEARSRGRVRVVSDDPLVEPEVDLGMLTDPEDRARLALGLQQLLDLIATPAMAELADAVYVDDLGTTPEDLVGADLESFCEANLGDYVHAAGTCRMGVDERAVVDPDGAVVSYEALRVCDASILPILPRANTHLPVTLVAEAMVARWPARR